jgi:hypothetical protein
MFAERQTRRLTSAALLQLLKLNLGF